MSLPNKAIDLRTLISLLTGVAILLWMIMIFWFSNQVAVTSSELSGGVCDRVVGKVNTIFSMGWSDQTQTQIAEKIEFPIRKAVHMSEYAVMAILVVAHLMTGTKTLENKKRRNYILAFLFTAGYAASDEFHQYFVPGRSAEVRDVMIDSAGAVLSLLVLSGVLLLCGRKKKLKNH